MFAEDYIPLIIYHSFYEKNYNTIYMNNQSSNNSIYDTIIRLFFVILIVAWCMLIMQPFVSIILWSLILALAISPLYDLVSKKMGGKKKLASFLIVFVILAIVFVPSFLLVERLVDEVKDIKEMYSEGTLSIPPPNEKVKDWPIVGDKFYIAWQNASDNLEQAIVKYKDQLTEFGKNLASGVLSAGAGLIQIMVSLIIAGILLVIGGLGESLRKFFRKVAGERGDEFADIIKATIGNVVKGIFGVAIIQTVLIGVGLMLAGVPYAGLLTLFIFMFAILQIPPTLVIIPVIVYIFSEKELAPAIIWSIYLMLAGLSDNVLKPILLGKGAPVPMLVIFIGVVGGFMFSGFIGLFTGAIVMSIGYKLFEGWVNSSDTPETGNVS